MNSRFFNNARKVVVNWPIMAVLESAALRSGPSHVSPDPFVSADAAGAGRRSLRAYTLGKVSTPPRPAVEGP